MDRLVPVPDVTMSSCRRSSRHRVFNSRYKDMQVELTPRRASQIAHKNTKSSEVESVAAGCSQRNPLPSIKTSESNLPKRKEPRSSRLPKLKRRRINHLDQCKNDSGNTAISDESSVLYEAGIGKKSSAEDEANDDRKVIEDDNGDEEGEMTVEDETNEWDQELTNTNATDEDVHASIEMKTPGNDKQPTHGTDDQDPDGTDNQVPDVRIEQIPYVKDEQVPDGTDEPIQDTEDECVLDETDGLVPEETDQEVLDGMKDQVQEGTADPDSDNIKEQISEGKFHLGCDIIEVQVLEGTCEQASDDKEEQVQEGTLLLDCDDIQEQDPEGTVDQDSDDVNEQVQGVEDKQSPVGTDEHVPGWTVVQSNPTPNLEVITIGDPAKAISKVDVIPVGNTVFLVDELASIKSTEMTIKPQSASTGPDEALPTVNISNSRPLSKTSIHVQEPARFVIKSENKMIDSEGKLVKARPCRPTQDDLLHISDTTGQYCCTKCDYKTDKKVNWYKHKIKHRERRYQCSKCEYKAATSSNLKRHLLSHDDVRNYGCKICWATFPQKIHLIRHIKYKHQPNNMQCSYCDYVCAEVQPDLVTHVKRKHPELCNLDKDGNLVKGDGEGALDAFMRYKCDHCNLYAVSRKDLQQHMKFHKKGPELKFFCELCSFVTECESRLKRHMLIHTKEKLYGCTMCKYRGSLPEHVKRHLKTKHKVEVSLSQRKSRQGSTNYNQFTEVNGVIMEGLKKPQIKSDTRNSEKHFACNFCTMKFTKLISLFKHVHVQHSQMMPPDTNYSCVVCDYSCDQYRRLLLHMRKVHSTANCMNTPQKQVYVCMSCDFSTPYRLFLHAHLKKEHNMQIITDKCMMDASKHSSSQEENEEMEGKKPGSIIKHTASDRLDEQASAVPKDSKMVLLQLTPDGPMTPVLINMGEASENSTPTSLLNGTETDGEYSIMETGISDNSSPLNMEECQVIFDEDLDQVLQESQVTSASASNESSSTKLTESSLTIPIKDLALVIKEAITEPSTTETILDNTIHVGQESSATMEKVSDVKRELTVEEKLSKQLAEDEVVHLSSGDFVEINGQIYKIEMEQSGEANSDEEDQ